MDVGKDERFSSAAAAAAALISATQLNMLGKFQSISYLVRVSAGKDTASGLLVSRFCCRSLSISFFLIFSSDETRSLVTVAFTQAFQSLRVTVLRDAYETTSRGFSTR